MEQFEIYFDGACNPTNPDGHMGYGYIIYKNGEYIHSNSFYEEACKGNTNNVAEYKACIEAIHYIKVYLIQENTTDYDIDIFGDSKLVVEQMSGRWKINSGAYRSWALRCKDLIEGMKLSFQWIPREENTEADELSVRELISRGIERKY